MRKNKLLAIAVLSFGAFSFLNFALASPSLSEVYLTVIGGNLTIGTTDDGQSKASLNLGEFTVSPQIQNAEGAFTDPFWVSDLKGATMGWYTTLQITEMVHESNSEFKIPLENIFIKAPTMVTTLAGAENTAVTIPGEWGTYRAFGTDAFTFIQKAAGSTEGLIGKYGVIPSIRVDIPAYQPLGKYTSTLTYTLMEG